MMNYKHALMEMIDRLVGGEWSVAKFREEYYFFYLDQVPYEALTDKDAEFFGYVQEKLDWTDENPDLESRSDGWINNDEYIEWVRGRRELFLRSLPTI